MIDFSWAQPIKILLPDMNNKMLEFNKSQKVEMPDIKSGDVVKVFRKIVEGGKERIQLFQGIVLAIKGRQSSSPTITVRKVSNGVGVELVLPIYSPMIEKIEVVKRAKVRRSKLYYIREKTAKSLKLKYTDAAELIGIKEEAPVEEVEIVAPVSEVITESKTEEVKEAEVVKPDVIKEKVEETK